VTNSDICPEDIPTPDTWESNSHPKTGKVLTASYNRKGCVDIASSGKGGTCAHRQS
jgi:hypothetical protein